ncbi:helix-turn-helix domain-containing protein [Methylophaga sp. OBS3]|uniref:helix-turn-helix domain-containing protein n=1 Tax=Methylophaga sp. OBS3 TaxID=2991934 RepID=UPI00225911A3|nr:helix-turn-helix domain-containing protein [Methylophaga sp. OBS3]MCX4189386.1 helix-turn-helix domain-containing protein [Methylophaga sp. OBS3]
MLTLDKKEHKKLLKISTVDHADAARAKALLALADGATQLAAAEQSGLTLPQVRYWLGRFRSKSVACFTSLNLETVKPKKLKKAKKTKADKKPNKTGKSKKDKSSAKKKSDKDKKAKKKKPKK